MKNNTRYDITIDHIEGTHSFECGLKELKRLAKEMRSNKLSSISFCIDADNVVYSYSKQNIIYMKMEPVEYVQKTKKENQNEK